jgi:COP9 signalosome complex subunit 5
VAQIDPNRTISAGRVDIGAFRTYPAGYSPPNASASEYQSIPLHKIEDFGVHANQYYSLDVQIFKSSMDTELLSLLWNKYWVNTLSQSPLISVRLLYILHLGVDSYEFFRIGHMLPLSSPIFIKS